MALFSKYLASFCFGLSFLFSQALIASNTDTPPNSLPLEAQKILDSLPEKKLTLPFLIAKAKQYSSSFDAIKAEESLIPQSTYESKVPLETNLNFSIARLINKNEPVTAYNSIKQSALAYQVGISSYFQTGTMLKTELTHQLSETKYSTFSQGPSWESKIKLSASQNLMKDFFGTATRWGLKAGELASQAQENLYYHNQDQWLSDLVTLYYQAWLRKSEYIAATESLKRKERLLKITKLKVKRGTAERPDLLQVQSSKMEAEVNLSAAHQNFQSLWRNLVLAVGLPKDWLSLNALLIPLKLDGPVPVAQSYCQKIQVDSNKKDSKNKLEKLIQKNPQFQNITLLADSSNYRMKKTKNAFLPEARIEVGLTANGVDTKASETLSEMSTNEHPSWFVQFDLKFPLSHYSEKAQLAQATAHLERTEAQRIQMQQQIEVDWLNTCADLSRLEGNTLTLKSAMKNQLERVKLEENRFQIGRVPTLTVINSGDEATRTELSYQNTRVSLNQTAWKIKRLANDLRKYFENNSSPQSP